jgi:hypothetical protein
MMDIPSVTLATEVFLAFFEDAALLGVGILAAASLSSWTSFPETWVSWDPSDWDLLLLSSSASAEKVEAFSSSHECHTRGKNTLTTQQLALWVQLSPNPSCPFKV